MKWFYSTAILDIQKSVKSVLGIYEIFKMQYNNWWVILKIGIRKLFKWVLLKHTRLFFLLKFMKSIKMFSNCSNHTTI